MSSGLLAPLALTLAYAAAAAELSPAALNAFETYVRTSESRIEEQLRNGDFLWVDDDAARLERVRKGQIAIQPWTRAGVLAVPNGLVHDWIGAVFIPGATLAGVLAAVQDYDNHRLTYRAEVLDSRLLNRNGDEFQIFLRVKKRRVRTVVLNTEHHVRYFRLSPTRTHSRSYSTRIAEVEHPGEAAEHERAVGDDHGYMWRLYSYWRFEERDGGVYVECRAISLTRDMPFALGWLVGPIIRGLPRESLASTLEATRKAVVSGR